MTAPTHLLPKLLCLATVLAVSACSTLKPAPNAAPMTNEGNNPVFTEPLKDDLNTKTPPELATLVFYRPGSATGSDAPMNIYVNGRFLSSLLPGGYVEHSNCSGPMTVAAVFDDARIRHLGKGGKETVIPLDAGKTYYFQADANGTESQGLLKQVETREVFLHQYRRQSHVLTRAPNCVAKAAPAVVAAPAPVAAMVAAPAVAAVKTVTPVVMPAAETVRAPLESWRAAWESGNYEAYKSFYAPDFKGTLPSRKAWEQQRRARLNNSAKSIVLENVNVKATPESVLTEFKQVYKSKQFDDIGQKRLVWKPVNGVLKIVEEGFIAR